MRIYCCSDLHSFFTPFKKALDEKGFEPSNPDHLLIVCGDVFDRGSESVEMYNFLNSLTNVVLVRGNHEDLLEEMLLRGYGERHDISNGTIGTVVAFADHISHKYFSVKECCNIVEEFIAPFLSKFVNYYESANFIFVHSFIALKSLDNLPKYYVKNRAFKFDPDWRNADNDAWELARWGNPFKLAAAGLNQTDKTIVFGHFHSSWPRANYEGKPEFGEGADFSPYFGSGYISLDACTAVSNTCNIIVLEDTLLEENKIYNSSAE